MRVINMGNIAEAYICNDLPAMGIVIEATLDDLERLPNRVYKEVTISATPRRNCDRFNTGDPMKDAEDAYGAWQRYCDDPTIPPSCKVESAFKNWLFGPATEGGNK